MVPALWEQTVSVATEQIPELQGVTVPSSSFRTDLAKQAVADLESDGLDVKGEGYERRDIELRPGGE